MWLLDSCLLLQHWISSVCFSLFVLNEWKSVDQVKKQIAQVAGAPLSPHFLLCDIQLDIWLLIPGWERGTCTTPWLPWPKASLLAQPPDGSSNLGTVPWCAGILRRPGAEAARRRSKGTIPRKMHAVLLLLDSLSVTSTETALVFPRELSHLRRCEVWQNRGWE